MQACERFNHRPRVSSVQVPFTETDRVDTPASLYAATKRSCELLASVYHNIYNVSTTGLRFFTVYGPWGRPDMAALAFAHKIVDGHPVKIFQGPNASELARDFTYIDDIVDVRFQHLSLHVHPVITTALQLCMHDRHLEQLVYDPRRMGHLCKLHHPPCQFPAGSLEMFAWST